MQKVKVHRYVSGKKPDYAHSDSQSDDEDFLDKRNQQNIPQSPEHPKSDEEMNDPRLRRLKYAVIEAEHRPERRRHATEAEVLESSDEESDREEQSNLIGNLLIENFSYLRT